jgi:cyanate permease
MKAERLKEEIGWLKVVVTLCSALFASLVPWLVQNYEIQSWQMVGVAACVTGFLMAIIFDSVRQIYRCIHQLGEL